MAFTYCPKIARINLTHETITEEHADATLVRQYIGGRGLGTKLALEECSPHNKIFLFTGPLTGMGASSSSRYSVITTSPVTHRLEVSNFGGTFGIRLKQSGYDALIIEGIAPRWTYIHITNDQIQLLDAHAYLGLYPENMKSQMKTKHGPHTSVLSIGIAGEQQIPFSTLMNDTHHAGGRFGFGAAMGSKNIKCITVSPSQHQAPQLLPKEDLQAVNICQHCPKPCNLEHSSDDIRTLCDLYGLDYISVSRDPSLIKDLHQRGIIKKEDLPDSIFGFKRDLLIEKQTKHKQNREPLDPALAAVIDSLGLCLFTAYSLSVPEYAKLLQTAHDIEYTPQELLEIGARINTLST